MSTVPKKVDTENCPNCGSDLITGGHVVVDVSSCYQEVSCDNCPAQWHDIFTYSGYEEVG